MSTPLGIAFIGAGDISLLHAAAIEKLSSARLRGLWNITPELAEEKANLFQCKIYPTLEALLNDPEVDAVWVLTNLETHHQYVMQALGADKHVFVEKPVSTTVGEIQDMLELARAKGKLCMPGHNYLYEPGIMRARELLDSGQLGQLVSLYVLYNIHHPEEVAARYPGVIRHIMTHHAYISLYLAGRPKTVSAMKSVIHYEEIPQEDLAMATLKTESGALVHLCASFAADDHAGDPWTMMVKLIGTKGATRFSYRDWVENIPATVHSQTYSAYPYSIDQIDRYFVEQCMEKGQAPLSSLADAITAQRIVEAIEVSVDEGRVVEI